MRRVHAYGWISMLIFAIGLGLAACNDASVRNDSQPRQSSVTQSKQLQRFLAKNPRPKVISPKDPVTLGFWDDVLSVVKEVGRCIVADGVGALVTGLTVLEITGNPDAAATGAVIGAVVASVEEALDEDLIAPGSPNPFNQERSPYNGSKPNSLDSVGWYHNSTLKTAVVTGVMPVSSLKIERPSAEIAGYRFAA